MKPTDAPPSPVQPEQDHDRLWELVKIAAIIAFALWGVFLGVGVLAIINDWSEKAGQFGDLFGSINAFFACVAAVGAITAVLLQRRALDLQKQELKEARAEMNAQTKIQDEHLKLLQSENAERRQIADLAVKPRLMLRWEGHTGDSGVIWIHNAGGPIFDLSVSHVNCNNAILKSFTLDQDILLEKGEPVKVNYLLSNSSGPGGKIEFWLHFRNSRNEKTHAILGASIDFRNQPGSFFAF